jgi:hypothetical protein
VDDVLYLTLGIGLFLIALWFVRGDSSIPHDEDGHDRGADVRRGRP